MKGARLTAAEMLDVSDRLRSDGLPELESEPHTASLVDTLRMVAGLRGVASVRLLSSLGVSIEPRRRRKAARKRKAVSRPARRKRARRA